MTINEIATDLRVALVNCINRDKSVSLADRYYFVIGQRDFSDEEIISFWLSVSCLENNRMPMFVVEKWAERSSNIYEWTELLRTEYHSGRKQMNCFLTSERVRTKPRSDDFARPPETAR
jgi:hypothetical protein